MSALRIKPVHRGSRDDDNDDDDAQACPLVYVPVSSSQSLPTYLPTYIQDASKDFRFGSSALKKVKFSIFGLGSSMYDEESFCKPAFDIENFMLELGATMIHETGRYVCMYVCFELWKKRGSSMD